MPPPRNLRLTEIVIKSLVMGLASTLLDFVWDLWIPAHTVFFGLMHGGFLLLLMGLLMPPSPRPKLLLRGAVGGLVIGLASAGTFYLTAPLVRWSALFAAWMVFWILFAFLLEHLDHSVGRRRSVLRGLAAALLSGVAFYGVSDMWLSPPSDGPNFWGFWIRWTLAFLPGFAALFAGRRRQTRS